MEFVDPTKDKINEIKHIREYCAERYGVSASLKTSLDLINSVCENYKEKQQEYIENVLKNADENVLNSILTKMGYYKTIPQNRSPYTY